MATHAVDSGVCRSRDADVGGVCAGIAEHFDLDPIVVRILAIFIALLTAGLGLIAYAVLWARLPRSQEPDVPYEVLPEHAESSSFGCVDCSTGRATRSSRSEPENSISLLARLAIAAGLTMLFLILAVNLSPLVSGTAWWQFWPLALVITGLCLVVIPVPTRYEAAWHALGVIVSSVAVTLLPISLNIMAWSTLPYTFSQAWPLLAIAAIMFVLGIRRENDALIICSSLFVAAFCMIALTLCAIPGDLQTLLVNMPDGRSIRIRFSG